MKYLAAGADISPCKRYRYTLWRKWGPGDWMAWLMLNPSTADGAVDDPTIRRCVGFAKRDGFGGILVVNLFAWRSPSPEALFGYADIGDAVGPQNDYYIQYVAREVPALVAAWGAQKDWRVAMRTEHVKRLLWAHSSESPAVYCLGHTRGGHPRHPLYVRADAKLERL